MGEEQVGQAPGAERAPWAKPSGEQRHTQLYGLKESWLTGAEGDQGREEQSKVRLDRWKVTWSQKALHLTKGKLLKGVKRS